MKVGLFILATLSTITGGNVTLFNLDWIYQPDAAYSLPREVLEEWASGKAFDHTEKYTLEESRLLEEDIQDIFDSSMARAPEPELRVVISAGPPGAGKTTLMETLLESDHALYTDPDAVFLKQMGRTFQKMVQEGEQTLEERKRAYDKWRPGSNYGHHLLTAHFIFQKLPFYFGTTAQSDKTKYFFDFLKKRGYKIEMIHVSAPSAVRWASIQKRDLEFVQTTEEDTEKKGREVPQRIIDYLSFCDTIHFYYRSGVDKPAVHAATWEKTGKIGDISGQLKVVDEEAYKGVTKTHQVVLDQLKKEKVLSQEDYQRLLWEKTVEKAI